MAKESEYKKRQEGNATVFDVTPADPQKFWLLVVIGALCILGGLGAASGGAGGFAFFWLLMGGFSFWYGWSRDQRPKPYKTKSTFRVTPTSIESNGRTFKTEDIHRLKIRNGITDQELDTGYQMEVTGAQAAGLAQRAKIARNAFGITLESAGKAHVIAGGVDSTMAYAILQDVSKIIGFNKDA